MDMFESWGIRALGLLLGGGAIAGGTVAATLGSSPRSGIANVQQEYKRRNLGTSRSFGAGSSRTEARRAENSSRYTSYNSPESHLYRQNKDSRVNVGEFSYTFVDKQGKWSCRTGANSMDAYHASLGFSNCEKPNERQHTNNNFELWMKGDAQELQVDRWEYAENAKKGDTWFEQLAYWIFRREMKLGWDRMPKSPYECKMESQDANSRVQNWHCVDKVTQNQ